MNQHQRACNSCQLAIKAYQNLVGSHAAFGRLVALLPAGDHLLLSSVFCFAVVKYAKPFIETETPFGKTKYPSRHLKKVEGFSTEVHEHLLELRNTLVAHDDLESIEPRILQFCMSIGETGFAVPVSVAVSNKCLAFPIDQQVVLKLTSHVAVCTAAVLEKIQSHLAEIRETTLKYPEQARERERYKKNYGPAQPVDADTGYQPPDFMGDEWLSSKEPDFSHIHNGLLYQELKIRKDFYGPETICLPDGTEFRIEPNPEPTAN